MSHQAVTFVKHNSRQKGGAYLCLLIIAEHAHADGTGSHPSIALLAGECRLDERHIRRLIDKLENTGELEVERGRGRGNSHQFTVVMTAKTDSVKPDISDIKLDILPGIDPVKPDILADKTGHFEQLKPDISNIKPDISDNCLLGYAGVGEPSGNRPKKLRERESARATENDLPKSLLAEKAVPRKQLPVFHDPPSLEAVEAFCAANDWPGLGQAALDFQAQRGWQMKSGPVMDWRAAIRTWKRNKDRYEEQDRQNAHSRQGSATGPPARAAPVTSAAGQVDLLVAQFERIRGR